MSDRTWNRLLGGMTVWALIGFFPIVVFAIGVWVPVVVVRTALLTVAIVVAGVGRSARRPAALTDGCCNAFVRHVTT